MMPRLVIQEHGARTDHLVSKWERGGLFNSGRALSGSSEVTFSERPGALPKTLGTTPPRRREDSTK